MGQLEFERGVLQGFLKDVTEGIVEMWKGRDF